MTDKGEERPRTPAGEKKWGVQAADSGTGGEVTCRKSGSRRTRRCGWDDPQGDREEDPEGQVTIEKVCL